MGEESQESEVEVPVPQLDHEMMYQPGSSDVQKREAENNNDLK